MFSYYGSKSEIVDRYPSPIFDTIIEPFAGSARYSLKYHWNDVVLIDKDEVIVCVWKFLQEVSPLYILSLPDVNNGAELEKINGFSQLSQEAKWLIGFCVNRGTDAPRNFAGNFNNWKKNKLQISRDLHKIRHWKIIHGDYHSIANIRATWFIDPPYQHGGNHYKHKDINFDNLAEWCQNRKGQAIVCENTKADWLPFYPMTKLSGQRHETTEAIWSNLPHEYEAIQQVLL